MKLVHAKIYKAYSILFTQTQPWRIKLANTSEIIKCAKENGYSRIALFARSMYDEITVDSIVFAQFSSD